jgi:hypothetical protein
MPVDAPGAIERGWREYNATVLPSAEDEGVRFLARLAYYAGAAHALGQLSADDEEGWAPIVAALAFEVMNETDKLVLAAHRGRLRP